MKFEQQESVKSRNRYMFVRVKDRGKQGEEIMEDRVRNRRGGVEMF